MVRLTRIKLSRSSDVGQGGFAWPRGSVWIFQPSASKEYNVNWDSTSLGMGQQCTKTVGKVYFHGLEEVT